MKGLAEWRGGVLDAIVAIGVVAGVATGLGAAPARAQVVELEPIASGLAMPLGVTHAGDGSGRLFIVLQGGQILVHDGVALQPQPFLDLASRVSCCGERGLLGLAFHPNYSRNGRFFVNYTNGNGATVVSEFRVSGDPSQADSGSEAMVLTFSQPFSNHNGGHLAFGPDGFLYIASGDGGSGGDPQNNGQDVNTLLGKLLRIDVDQGPPFAVPAGNPFAGGGGEGEIWAYGLRNPWRFSFDRRTGDLYIGDVGQNAIEEINFQRAASAGGQNYGWRRMEGQQCFEPATGCNDGSLTLPILQYNHGQGCSVTAGFRYRGPEVDTLPRFFLYGDFCSGRLWGGIADRFGNWRSRQLALTGLSISSFGEDEAGHVYVVGYGGTVHRLRGLPLFASDFEDRTTDDWSARRGDLVVVQPGLKKSDSALEVPVDGTRVQRFLRSDEPRNEETFHVEFRLNANRVNLGGGQVTILKLEGQDDPARLSLLQEGDKYFVEVIYSERFQDAVGSSALAVRRTQRVRVPRKRAALIGLDFLRARTTGSFDGEIRLLKKGKVRVSSRGIANGTSAVDAVKIGLPAGSRGAVGGSFLIDDYRSSP